MASALSRFDTVSLRSSNGESGSGTPEAGSGTPEAGSGAPVAVRVIEHDIEDLNLQRAAYLLAKGDRSGDGSLRALPTESVLLKQKIPVGNTVLHIAAAHGNNEVLDLVAHQREALCLLDARNSKGDTALHVAAKAGDISILKRLFALYLREISGEYSANSTEALKEIPFRLLDFTLSKNKRGNTLFHEALLNGHKGVMEFLVYDEAQRLNAENEGNSSLALFEARLRELVQRAAPFTINKEQKSVLYLAVENGYKEFVDQALAKLTMDHNPEVVRMIESDERLAELVPHNPEYVPEGKSPLYASILKPNRDILETIIDKKREWIHLRDDMRRTPLHYAASVGYLDGVLYLISKCYSCTTERDETGMFPLHLAAEGGHVGVVRELVRHCMDATEMLDSCGRNILHIAADSGKIDVVNYILQAAELKTMIKEKDEQGNTPLHLASRRCHPKIVHALTSATGVEHNLVNHQNKTPLDLACSDIIGSPSLQQWLTQIALNSAGVEYSNPPGDYVEPLGKSIPSKGGYKVRSHILMLVSTLITTVTFAAGFTLPGGNNDSHPGQGRARMLNRIWFKLFILCNTISMYSAFSTTIILIWAQLEVPVLAFYAVQMALPLLGVSLATLSVAFSAGVYLVVSDLTWLAITLLAIGGIFTIAFLLVYTLLRFPRKSKMSVVRGISYYPFLLMAWLAERPE